MNPIPVMEKYKDVFDSKVEVLLEVVIETKTPK
jgi:hypothetical protein